MNTTFYPPINCFIPDLQILDWPADVLSCLPENLTLYWLIPCDFQSRDKFAEFKPRGSFQNDQIHIWVDSLYLAHKEWLSFELH